MMTKPIKTAFIFDSATDVPLEEEVGEAISELERVGLTILCAAMVETVPQIFGSSFDLVVMDYGGASLAWGGGEMQVDGVLRWAENHPGSLVVLWSKHISEIYFDELYEQYASLNNVLLRFEEKDSAFSFIGRDENVRFNEALRRWFGLTENRAK